MFVIIIKIYKRSDFAVKNPKMHKNINQKKGFTLIELLVVLAIVAVLALVTIFTLNPAELLRQARDSNRISDMGTLKTAISLYLADVSVVNLNGGNSNRVYASGGPGTGLCATVGTLCYAVQSTSGHGGPYNPNGVIGATSAASTTSKSVNGNGWLPVNFSSISSGTPFGSLPADPTNNSTLFYMYMPTTTGNGITFKIAMFTESSKYGYQGTADIVTGDGGNSTSSYETGTEIGM